MLCIADATDDVVHSATLNLQASLQAVIDNLDFRVIVAKLWTKALDLHTWIDLSEPDYEDVSNVSDLRPGASPRTKGQCGKRKRTRMEKYVHIAFHISEQYPDQVEVVLRLFMLQMLGVAFLLGVLTHWNMSW